MLSNVIVILAGYVICLVVGSFFVKLMLNCISKDFINSESKIEKAGMIIGMLERFIILTFVLLGEYIAISFILTAKSIARFKKLEDRNFAEYYLVGTLASVSFAILIGLIMKKILNI